MTRLPRNRIIVGDALSELRKLPDASIDTVFTSPPYYRLRNYQVDGQLGLEPHVDDWVTSLRAVARELQRVLLPTGSFWLNLADTYSTHARQGAARKSLLLGPARLVLQLVGDGWLLRNHIVWHKPNPMPTSVRDRLAATWESIYVFTRQPQAFFDLDSIRQPHTSRRPTARPDTPSRGRASWLGSNAAGATGLDSLRAQGLSGHPLGKNPGDVWKIASSRYRGAHHATFPVSLAIRAIQAGSPEARCIHCRAPWGRQLIRSLGGTAIRGALGPTCTCEADREPAVVLDPFFGAGTTAVAAEALARDWLGIELNPDFAALAEHRIRAARAGPRTAA